MLKIFFLILLFNNFRKNDLENTKVFLLDSSDWNFYYGSDNPPKSPPRNSSITTPAYWLRTYQKFTEIEIRQMGDEITEMRKIRYPVAYMAGNNFHEPSTSDISAEIGVSPAFNIKLSSIISSSASSTEENTYKLTLCNNDMTIAVREDEDHASSRKNNTITVPIRVTVDNMERSHECSIIMTDGTWSSETGWSSGAELYHYDTQYIPLYTDNDNLNSRVSSATFTLPADYDPSWNTYILVERSNGDRYTDYASGPVLITIPAAPAHTHAWTFTASRNVITAECTNDGHSGSAFATLTLNAPLHTVYGDGESAAATITGTIDGVAAPVIVYKKGSTTLDAAPTDAGS